MKPKLCPNAGLPTVVGSYLAAGLPLSAIWDWLALYQWDLKGDDLAFSDAVEDALIWFYDDYITEVGLQAWLVDILARLPDEAKTVSK